MAEQPGKQRGDEPRTDLPPKTEPYYEGYFGDEDDGGRAAADDESGDAPAREGKGGMGGEGEGPL
jgi:hypothetical protein